MTYNGMNQQVDPRMLMGGGMGGMPPEQANPLLQAMGGRGGWEGMGDKFASLAQRIPGTQAYRGAQEAQAAQTNAGMQRLASMKGQGQARPNQKELDAKARAMGYKDFETWRNWQARQDEMNQLPNPQGGGGMGDAVNQGMSWHPAWLLDWVNQRIKGATGQSQ